METTISGANNWRLRIRREREGITILRAVTCDAEAALPEALFGLPVTALGDHALAPGAREIEGEAVTVTGAPGTGEWDNRNLRSLTLPRTLLRIGNYAFLNCGQLQKITLFDNIKTWGGSVFMNCRLLSAFDLTREAPPKGKPSPICATCSPVSWILPSPNQTGEPRATYSPTTGSTMKKTVPPTCSTLRFRARATRTTIASSESLSTRHAMTDCGATFSARRTKTRPPSASRGTACAPPWGCAPKLSRNI